MILNTCGDHLRSDFKGSFYLYNGKLLSPNKMMNYFDDENMCFCPFCLRK